MNFGKIEQYILFGGGQLLASTARNLKRGGYSVFVVTSKRHLAESVVDDKTKPLKNFLEANHIDYITSKNVSDDLNVIKRVSRAALGLSFGATWIFKKPFIERFEGRLLNLHAARLPQDRGGGGFSWRILRSERIGVSLIHQIDSGVDTGDIVLHEDYVYPASCRLPSDYIDYTIKKYQSLLDRFFTLIREGKQFSPVSQQDYLSSYWPRLSTDIHGYINWNWSLADIERFVCAFDDPYDGAITFINGDQVRVKNCFSWASDGVFHPFQKGIIYRKSDEALFVAAGEGSLLINRVLDKKGNDMKRLLRVGDRFYTPHKWLEDAMQYRAKYSHDGLKK